MDKVKDDVIEKGLSAEEVYDRATWRIISSYIDPHKSGNTMKKTKKKIHWVEGVESLFCLLRKIQAKRGRRNCLSFENNHV